MHTYSVRYPGHNKSTEYEGARIDGAGAKEAGKQLMEDPQLIHALSERVEKHLALVLWLLEAREYKGHISQGPYQ